MYIKTKTRYQVIKKSLGSKNQIPTDGTC